MKNNFITKIIGATLAFAMMIGGAIGINAAKEAKEVNAVNEVVYKRVTFDSDTMGSSVQDYTSTWTNTTTGETGIAVSLTNFNNNAKGWNYVKTGNKKNASVGTITTVSSIDVAITKVNITIDAITVSNVNSIKLFTSTNKSSWTEAGSYDKQNGEKSVALSSPTKDLYYKLEFDCKKGGSNGIVTVSQIDYYYDKPSDSSKTIQANNVVIKCGEEVISSTYEPTAGYCIGDTLDLTNSFVEYQKGDTFEDGNNILSWESSNDEVAVVSNGIVTFVSSGMATITATADDKGENNATVSASFLLNINNAGPAHGSETNPYTVSEAKAAIDEKTTVDNAYVKGIVSKFPNNPFNSTDGCITYFISADGSTSGFQFEAYKGKGIDGANFTSASDVKIGAAVVIKGTLSKYNSTYQLNADNQLVSYVQPFTVSFETNGGSTVESQIVLDGEKAQRPADPTKAATQDYTYTFANWYDNSSFTGEPYDFETPVTADLVLYAKWNEIPAPARDVIGRMTTGTQLSYRYTKTGEGARDHLNRTFTGIGDTNNYSDWNNKVGASGAVYAGNSAGDNDSIQLRSNNSNSGVVTTTSGGNAKMVKIVWNPATANGRVVDVYGKNTAYTSASELYNAQNQGTKIGSLTASTTILNITDDYAFIGIRSNSGALYLDSITIQWGELEYDYSDISIRFGGNVTKDLWNRLDSESTITGFGVMVTESKNVENFDEFKTYIESDVFESSENSEDYNKDIVDYYIPVTSMASVIGENANNYFWNLRLDIDKANMNKTYSAIAYIKINDGYVLMNMATESVETLALDYLTNRGCNETTAGGSLQAIVDNAQ